MRRKKFKPIYELTDRYSRGRNSILLFGVGLVYDVCFKMLFSIVFGIVITIASLPVVVIIVYFNKSYLTSTLLAFFYSIFNWGIIGLFESIANKETAKILNLFPVICAMDWTSGKLVNRVIKDQLSAKAYDIFPTDFYTFVVLTVTLVISLWLIIKFYKKWTR